MTRDGFSFLAMGFTGREAAKWKENFLTAFNAMEGEIKRLQIENTRLMQLTIDAQAKERLALIKDIMVGPTARIQELKRLTLENELEDKKRLVANAAAREELARTKRDERIADLQRQIDDLNKKVKRLEDGGLDNEENWEKIRKRRFGVMSFDYLH